MKYTKLILFLVVSNLVFFFSCSPTKRLVYHSNQIENILEEHPELKKNISLDSLIKKDSILVDIEVNDSISLEVDSSDFDMQLDSIFFYKQILDSLEQQTKEDTLSINTKDKEIKSLINKIGEIILDKKKNLSENIFTDKRFTVYLPITYKTNDSIKVDSLALELFFYKGKIHLIGYDNSKLEFDKTDYTLTVEKGITFFAWIKDEKTLFLTVLIAILLVLLFFTALNRRR